MGLLARLFAWLIPAGIGALGTSIISMGKKLIVGLGFGFIAYQGFDALMSWVIGMITANIAALPADIFQILAYMGVFKGLNILFSGWAIGLSIIAQKTALAIKPNTTSAGGGTP